MKKRQRAKRTKQRPTSYTHAEVMALLYAERQRYPSMRAMAKAWGCSHTSVAAIFQHQRLGIGSVALAQLGLSVVTAPSGAVRYVPEG
jgi:hypothetical protein